MDAFTLKGMALNKSQPLLKYRAWSKTRVCNLTVESNLRLLPSSSASAATPSSRIIVSADSTILTDEEIALVVCTQTHAWVWGKDGESKTTAKCLLSFNCVDWMDQEIELQASDTVIITSSFVLSAPSQFLREGRKPSSHCSFLGIG